jgi:hypothetical protein
MIRKKVEFTEGTYKALWSAIVKTKDNDLIALWKEQIQKEEKPILHYTIIKEYLIGILNDLTKQNIIIDTEKILHNCNKEGYYKKHYTLK